jgi:hypothetical protein
MSFSASSTLFLELSSEVIFPGVDFYSKTHTRRRNNRLYPPIENVNAARRFGLVTDSCQLNSSQLNSYRRQQRARAGCQTLAMTIRRALLSVLLCLVSPTAQNRPAPAKTELAPGIFLFTTPSHGDVGLDMADGYRRWSTIRHLPSAISHDADSGQPSGPSRRAMRSYLPEEKIVLIGDLIVNPLTFALSGYPRNGCGRRSASTPRRRNDRHRPRRAAARQGLLLATMDVCRVLLREGKAAKARGLDPDQAKAEILPGVRDLMVVDCRRRSGEEQRVPHAARRLVSASCLRRAERPAQRYDCGDPANVVVVFGFSPDPTRFERSRCASFVSGAESERPRRRMRIRSFAPGSDRRAHPRARGGVSARGAFVRRRELSLPVGGSRRCSVTASAVLRFLRLGLTRMILLHERLCFGQSAVSSRSHSRTAWRACGGSCAYRLDGCEPLQRPRSSGPARGVEALHRVDRG